MAGLFESIVKGLFGSGTSKNVVPMTKTSDATMKVKPAAAPVDEQKIDTIVPEPEQTEQTEQVITAIDRTNKRERTQDEVERDDYLLTQIDEFREKAQHLQELLLSKESKVQELQEIVDEKEGKAKELEIILDERQKKADGITDEVSKQIDSLIDKVSAKMDEIGTSLGKNLQDGQKFNERQLEEIKDTLGTFDGQQMEELKNAIHTLNTQQAEELKQALSELNAQLEVVKAELSEKVHSENVKCYRNLADLLKSVEDKLDKANEIEKKVDSIHRSANALIVLSVLNMVGLIALVLFELGAFPF